MTAATRVKLAIIECAACTALLDVFQQHKPEAMLIWSRHGREPELCQHPSLMECPQARAEVALRFGDDARSLYPASSAQVPGVRSTSVGLTSNKSLDRRPDKTSRRRADR